MYNFLGSDEIGKMKKTAEKLDKIAILKHFTGQPINVIVYDVTDSTNTRARDMLKEGKQPLYFTFRGEGVLELRTFGFC